MRFSRLLAAFSVVAVAALAVGWRVAASQPSSRPKPPTAIKRTGDPHYLVIPGGVRQVPQARALPPSPRACPVAGDCSETPCTLDIADQNGIARVASGLAGPAEVRPDQVPLGGNCQGFVNTAVAVAAPQRSVRRVRSLPR